MTEPSLLMHPSIDENPEDGDESISDLFGKIKADVRRQRRDEALEEEKTATLPKQSASTREVAAALEAIAQKKKSLAKVEAPEEHKLGATRPGDYGHKGARKTHHPSSWIVFY